jgi:hypothetical protein
MSVRPALVGGVALCLLSFGLGVWLSGWAVWRMNQAVPGSDGYPTSNDRRAMHVGALGIGLAVGGLVAAAQLLWPEGRNPWVIPFGFAVAAYGGDGFLMRYLRLIVRSRTIQAAGGRPRHRIRATQYGIYAAGVLSVAAGLGIARVVSPVIAGLGVFVAIVLALVALWYAAQGEAQ